MRLLATEAKLEAGEDLLGRNRRDAPRVDVVHASLDLGLPVLPEVRGIQTG
jgi:gamma-glutamyl-gamma-aminobutyrate hydrolase PuuD